jgi:6-phosphogluconolactonase
MTFVLVEPTTTTHEFHVLKDRRSVGIEVARRVAAAAKRQRDEFRIALSGGSALTLLSEGVKELTDTLDFHFENWKVAVVDERLNDEDSNLLACRKALPSEITKMFGVDPKFYDDAEAAARYYENILKTEFKEGFHVIIMGMGGDGHTASLFPNHEFWDKDHNNELVASILNSPKPPSRRITLTPKALSKARETFFVTVGSSKSEKVREVFELGKNKILDSDQKRKLLVRFPASIATNSAEWFVDEDAWSMHEDL